MMFIYLWMHGEITNKEAYKTIRMGIVVSTTFATALYLLTVYGG